MRTRSIFPVERLPLLGGRLCLDFANTANRLDGHPCDERFDTYEDVVRWSERLGLIDGTSARRLRRAADRSSARAAAAIRSVHELRKCLWDLFSGRPTQSAVRKLQVLARRAATPKLKLGREGRIAFEPGTDLTGWLVRAITGSAVELLVGPERGRVKVCPGDRCGWLFLDESTGDRRKWCSMKTCGNRRKAREHYGRLRRVAR